MGASNSNSSSASNSNSSSTSNSGSSSSGCWSNQIYFDPESDKNEGSGYNIKDAELLQKMTTLVDHEEYIKTVKAYKCPVRDWQLTSLTMYHLFIIFETEKWWWSIEKHTDGITIQRSKNESDVKRKYRKRDRKTPISFVKKDCGRKTVEQLIRWLYYENELHKSYHVVFSNCKTFAKRVFDHVGKTEYLYWYDGAFS